MKRPFTVSVPADEKKRGIVFTLLMAVSIALLVWRCGFGFASTFDEPFYYTIPHRFLLGDTLMVDEWNVSQLSAVLSMPLIGVFRALTGGMDGVIRFMRYAYVALHAFVSCFFYLRTCKYGWASVLSSLIWMLFLPYLLPALSYNTWCMELLLLCCVWAATSVRVNPSWILMGILFALCVLCCPYLAVMYVIYAGTVAVRALLKKRMGEAQPLLQPRGLLFITLGCGVSAVLFLIFALRRASLTDMLNQLQYVFSDSAHSFVSPFVKASDYLRDVSLIYSYVEYGMVFLWLMLLLLCAVIALDGQRSSRKGGYLLVACMLMMAAQLMMGDWLQRHFQTVVIPLIFLALPAFLLCEKKDWGLFAGLFIPGKIYSVCQFCASNNEEYAAAIGFAVAGTSAGLFAAQALREMADEEHDIRRVLSACVAACLVFTAGLSLAADIGWAYNDVSPTEADAVMLGGPFDGIRTSGENAERYQASLNDLRRDEVAHADSMLLIGCEGWPYLALDHVRYATFSAWINEGEEHRLIEYFEGHPGLKPGVILLPKSSRLNGEDTISMITEKGYTLMQGEAYLIFIREP